MKSNIPLIGIAGVLLFGGLFFYRQRMAEHEAAMVAQQHAMKAAAEALRAAAASREGAGDSNELRRLRITAAEVYQLRGEVARLREEKAVLEAQVAAQDAVMKRGAPSPSGPSAAEKAAEAPVPADPFRSRVDAQVNFGETLLTGGWEVSPGRRVVMVLRPELNENGGGAKTVTVRMKGVELPEAALGKLGLEGLSTAAAQTEQHGLVVDQGYYEELIARFNAEPGSSILSSPSVQTLPGTAAEIFVGSSAGEGLKLQVVPGLRADGTGFDLRVETTLSRPKAP